MRSIIATLIVLALTCGVSGVSIAQQRDDTGAAGGQLTDQLEKTITATVEDVNANQKKITVTGDQGNKVEYTLSNDTQIVRRTGETITIGDLKPGAKVSITYKGTNDNPRVTKVEVQPG